MAARNNGVTLSTAVVAVPNLQPTRRNQDAGAAQNEEATVQAGHVAEIAVEFAGNRDVPYSQLDVLATNASKTRLLGEAYIRLLDTLDHAGYVCVLYKILRSQIHRNGQQWYARLRLTLTRSSRNTGAANVTRPSRPCTKC